MAVTGGRILAHASVQLFDAGEGDPTLTDHGFAWYDAPAAGAEPRRSGHAELLPELGYTCAPSLSLQDTRLTHWSTSTSSGVEWQEVYPLTGAPQRYRLQQPDTSPGVTWTATSSGSLPAGPSVAFSLILADTPPDWDADALPPEVRIALGDPGVPGAAWSLLLSKQRSSLEQWDGTAWQERLALSNPARSAGYGDGEELYYWLRCLAGRILVSTDGGYSYQTAGSLAEPAVLAAGPVRITGHGGTVILGVHQLLLVEAEVTSRARDTLTERVTPAVVLEGVTHEPAGTSVALADEYSGRLARYRATLTPASSTWLGPGWSVYRAPVLHAVNYLLFPTAVPGAGTSSTPWDERLLSIEIDKPEDLGQASATIRVKLDATTALTTAGLRRRKLAVTLGYQPEGESLVSWTAFVGYVRTVSVMRDRYGEGVLELVADNFTAALRRRRWTDLHVQSLAGLTVNDASDRVLTWFGIPLDSSHRVWHPWGELVTLADGTAGRPCELIRPGDDPWETLRRIQSFARLELAATDDGALIAVQQDFTTGVSHDLRAVPASTLDLRELAEGFTHTVDYDATGTAVLVSGTDGDGEAVWAWAVDTEAETQPLSERYCPWREVELDSVRDTVSPAMLIGRAQLLAQRRFGLQYWVDAPVYLHDEVSRRDSVLIYGFEQEAVPTGTEYLVMALRHRVEVRSDGEAVLTTQLGLRRL